MNLTVPIPSHSHVIISIPTNPQSNISFPFPYTWIPIPTNSRSHYTFKHLDLLKVDKCVECHTIPWKPKNTQLYDAQSSKQTLHSYTIIHAVDEPTTSNKTE